MEQKETKFSTWVRGYGINKLVRSMGAAGQDFEVTFSAVYQWLRGEHEPRYPKIRKMVELAAGELTLEDVHAHFEVLRAARSDTVVGP